MGSGLLSPTHIALVLVIALIVFGPKRLPELGRSLGHGMRGFKEAIAGDEPDEPEPAAPGSPSQMTSAGAERSATAATASDSQTSDRGPVAGAAVGEPAQKPAAPQTER